MFPPSMRHFCEMHVQENVPRLTEIGTGLPSLNILQPRHLRISNGLSLVTNRNLFIIFFAAGGLSKLLIGDFPLRSP
jgi:hypothetical protein